MENEKIMEVNATNQHQDDDHTVQSAVQEDTKDTRSMQRGVRIDLGLEIGRVIISLSDWNEVSEGSILMLEGVKVGQAYLTDFEGVIAYGELLDVDGTIGFQIKRWRTA